MNWIFIVVIFLVLRGRNNKWSGGSRRPTVRPGASVPLDDATSINAGTN